MKEASRGGADFLGAPLKGVSVTLSGVALFFLFLLIAAPASFVAGVLLGRSHPLTPAPIELPKKEAKELDGGDVLSGADLDFSRMLHVAEGEKVQEARPQSSFSLIEVPQKKEAVAPSAATEGSPQPKGQVKSNSAPEPQPKALVGESRKPSYDYVFQVAAYKVKEHAERQLRLLSAKGLRARIRPNGKMLIVLLFVRGPDDAASGVGLTLKSMGYGTPILLSKKPVSISPTSTPSSASPLQGGR